MSSEALGGGALSASPANSHPHPQSHSAAVQVRRTLRTPRSWRKSRRAPSANARRRLATVLIATNGFADTAADFSVVTRDFFFQPCQRFLSQGWLEKSKVFWEVSCKSWFHMLFSKITKTQRISHTVVAKCKQKLWNWERGPVKSWNFHDVNTTILWLQAKKVDLKVRYSLKFYLGLFLPKNLPWSK